MRIPLYKTYRAFSELDDLTDAQCELLMKRVQLRIGTNLGVVCLFVLLYPVLVAACYAFTAYVGNIAGFDIDRVSGAWLVPVVFGLAMGVFALPAIICLFLRDAILRRRLTAAIQYEVDRVRCLSCRYILIGQVASGGRIGCPECGASFALAELGITEADLLPPGEANATTV